MKHEELNQGMMRAYLDGQLDPLQVAAIEPHLEGCAPCREQLGILRGHATLLQDCLNRLPESAETANTATAWAAFQKKREDSMENERNRWTWLQKLSLVSGGFAAAAVVLGLDGSAGPGVGGELAGDLPRPACHRARDRSLRHEERHTQKQSGAQSGNQPRHFR